MKLHLLSDILLGFLFLCIGAPVQSHASIVDFEGLSNAAAITDGYAGLNWDNFNVLNNAVFNANVTPGGAMFGYINLGPSDPTPFTGLISTNPGEVFDFKSGFFASGWTDNLQLTVQGYLNGSMVSGYDQTITLDYRNPLEYSFNYLGIDELWLVVVEPQAGYNQYSPGEKSGGPYYWQQQYNFMIDDLDITEPSPVPLPGAAVLLLSGLAGLLGIRKKLS